MVSRSSGLRSASLDTNILTGEPNANRYGPAYTTEQLVNVLITQGQAILAEVGAAGKDAVFAVEQYGLAAAQGIREIGEDMAALGEAAADGCIYARLDIDAALLWEEAREVECGLHVLAIDIAVEHHRHVTHRLVGPAHHAEGQIDLALRADHGGDDGMERALA